MKDFKNETIIVCVTAIIVSFFLITKLPAPVGWTYWNLLNSLVGSLLGGALAFFIAKFTFNQARQKDETKVNDELEGIRDYFILLLGNYISALTYLRIHLFILSIKYRSDSVPFNLNSIELHPNTDPSSFMSIFDKKILIKMISKLYKNDEKFKNAFIEFDSSVSKMHKIYKELDDENYDIWEFMDGETREVKN